MLKNLVTEKYNRVEFKDLLKGKVNQGVTHLFNEDDLVIVTEGTEGEKYIYVDRLNYNNIKKELSLEFIMYDKVLYITGSSAELHYNLDMGQGIDFTQIANDCDIEVKLWGKVAGQFLSQFREKYVNYLMYLSMDKQDEYSSSYNTFVEMNIDKVKKKQHEDAMIGIFEPKSIYENIWLNQGEGLSFTRVDIIKYVLDEKCIDELVKIYYDRDYINDERIMHVHLYNKLQKENQSPEVVKIKEKIKALNKAGKTANVLIQDNWIKVENTLIRGNLREATGWTSYPLKDVEAIKFNGKILYQE